MLHIYLFLDLNYFRDKDYYNFGTAVEEIADICYTYNKGNFWI